VGTAALATWHLALLPRAPAVSDIAARVQKVIERSKIVFSGDSPEEHA
jgi:hypothetical protein